MRSQPHLRSRRSRSSHSDHTPESREHVLDSPGVDKVPGDPGDDHHALEGGVHQEQVHRGRGLTEAVLERHPGQVHQGKDDGLSLTRSLTKERRVLPVMTNQRRVLPDPGLRTGGGDTRSLS